MPKNPITPIPSDKSRDPADRHNGSGRSPGRPPSGGDTTRGVHVTLRGSQIEAIDAAARRDGISRSAALRRIIDRDTG